MLAAYYDSTQRDDDLLLNLCRLRMSRGISLLDLFQALRDLRKEGLTILLVEQNVQMALQVSDYAYVLGEGRTVLHGPAREVAADEGVRKAYLGL